MRKKSKFSLKVITYVPLSILIVVVTLICTLVFIVLQNTDILLNDVQNTYMSEINILNTLQQDVETLNNYSLSHIISTNFTTKVELNRKIVALEKNMNTYIYDLQGDEYLDENYDSLVSDFQEVVININQLMA